MPLSDTSWANTQSHHSSIQSPHALTQFELKILARLRLRICPNVPAVFFLFSKTRMSLWSTFFSCRVNLKIFSQLVQSEERIEQWMIVWVEPSSLCPRLSSQPPGNAPHTIHLINWEGKRWIFVLTIEDELFGKNSQMFTISLLLRLQSPKGWFSRAPCRHNGPLLSALPTKSRQWHLFTILQISSA